MYRITYLSCLMEFRQGKNINITMTGIAAVIAQFAVTRRCTLSIWDFSFPEHKPDGIRFCCCCCCFAWRGDIELLISTTIDVSTHTDYILCVMNSIRILFRM